MVIRKHPKDFFFGAILCLLSPTCHRQQAPIMHSSLMQSPTHQWTMVVCIVVTTCLVVFTESSMLNCCQCLMVVADV